LNIVWNGFLVINLNLNTYNLKLFFYVSLYASRFTVYEVRVTIAVVTVC